MNGSDMLFDYGLYDEGSGTYASLLSAIEQLSSNFDDCVRDADIIESETAKVDYAGTYPEILEKIKSSIDSLSEALSTSKSKVDAAKSLIEQYSNGITMISDDSLIFSLNAITDDSHLYSIGNSPDKTIDYSNIYGDGYEPQGLTVIGDQILISAYKEDKKSRIYVYDINDSFNSCIIDLDNKAHVGGITYDAKNDVLLVSGQGGYVNAYNYGELKRYKVESGKKYLEIDQKEVLKTDININYKQARIGNRKTTDYENSTVYFDNVDGKIYITDFASDDYKGHTTVATMVLKNGQYVMEDAKTYEVDGGIQGLTTYHKDNKNYLVESRSYGSNQSQITVKDITNGMDNQKIVGTKTLDKRYAEGIFVDNQGNATVVHEKWDKNSTASDVSNNNQTTSVNINSIIEEHNSDEGSIEIKGKDNRTKYDKGNYRPFGYETKNAEDYKIN